MKELFKKYFEVLYAFLKLAYVYKRNLKYIRNYYNSSYSKRALLSYITLPFEKTSKSHTNFFEAQSIAKALHELGFIVDVINSNYSGVVYFNKYDLLIGSGNAFIQYFARPNKKIVTICYCTGLHPVFQNESTLKKLKQFYLRKGVWIGDSCRYVETSWTHQINLSDALIVLGNKVAYDSFVNFNNNIYLLPTPFYKTIDSLSPINDFECRNKNFLWIGGLGLLHKGLDVLLDIFLARSDINLTVMGDISAEKDFFKIYSDSLASANNIHFLGFVDIESELFKSELKKCTFVIIPSVSEGGSPSIVTAVGNGALLPIHTKEASVDFMHSILIEDSNFDGTLLAIEKALNLSPEQLRKMRTENYFYTNNFHGNEIYYRTLYNSLMKILSNHVR